MATANQNDPALVSGGIPEPHGPSAAALCAPHRVLPPDHPVRLLARALHDDEDLGVRCKLIRAVAASGRAHIKKKQFHHADAVTELSFLGLDSYPEGRFTTEVLDLYRDALLYHKARSASVKQKLAPGVTSKEQKGPKVKDEVAMSLQGLTLNEMYEMAATVLGTPRHELETKYGHLNPGMQRMNLGNRMRAKK